jgi:hypothetical protein
LPRRRQFRLRPGRFRLAPPHLEFEARLALVGGREADRQRQERHRRDGDPDAFSGVDVEGLEAVAGLIYGR